MKKNSQEEERLNALFEDLGKEYPYMEKQVETKMRIACKLDDQRRKLGWSIKDMAKAFNKTPKLMEDWMSGTYNYTIDTIVLIEQVMGINLINRKKL